METLTEPITFPPLDLITEVPSRTIDLPSALSVAMKYHFLPPCCMRYSPIVCEAAQVSKVHWMVLGEQYFPVRSDEAALEAISAALVPRTTSFTAMPTAEFGTSAIASTFS